MKLCRVAYLVSVFPKLSETFIAMELAELRRRGIEVCILSLRPPEGKLRHRVIADAGLAERTHYDPRQFARVARQFRPQLIHAHFATQATQAARELAAELKLPFTFTAHRYDIYDKPPADFADRRRAAAAAITVSDENARYMARAFGVRSVHVIPCGVDTDQFRPQRLTAGLPYLVCVARLKPFKNQQLLLKACALLRSRGVEFRCVLVGDGPCREELEALCAHLQLEEVVQFAGAAVQDDVIGWWQRAAVAVLPSNSEGMPVCLMEAASCGVPAVATRVGGIPELIEEGVTGLIVPPGDAGRLAAAVEKLVRAPELAARMGRAARERAEQRFSLKHQVDRLLGVWTQVLERKRELEPARA